MSPIERFKAYLSEINCEYICDEAMSRHTSFKIGGSADIFIMPRNENDVVDIINFCKAENVKYYIVGNGSNLLISDEGLRGAVISFGKQFGDIVVKGDTVTAQAGALLSTVCRFACDNSLGGLEFAFGIPGSVGGAVFMNAGAYGGEMKDVIVSVRALFPNGEIRDISVYEAGFGYRTSAFQSSGAVILSADFKLAPRKRNDIEADMNDIINRRKDKQPLEWPSAGSAFKRPQNGYAAELIDRCGLKGFTVGGAQVSEKHAGFVINRGGASCEDVLLLLDKVRSIVFDKTGIMLEAEIKRFG